MKYIWARLLRIRLTSAIILALPGIFLCIWYSSSAILKLRNYELAVDEEAPGNLEFFHIHLYDILSRDVRWILSPGEPEKSKIETFVLEVSHSNMIDLYGGAGKTSDRPYVPAKMVVNSQPRAYDIEIRLRGSRHWHHLSRKKSLKIKMLEGKPYKGHEVFNLINQATPLVVGQKIVADTAAANGVMVPPYEFVRVVLNGEDLGVFHFQAQPDDTLFRKNRTMYSDFFSGNLSNSDDMMALWKEPDNWKKVTSRLHSNKHDIERLKEFLHNITDASYEQFAAYAKHHINLEAFAEFEAIDVIFGVEQHGFRENQKLYFDPYKGSWVPVAWDLRGFKHDGVINRVENPITIRLKMLPEYRSIRNRAIWSLLQGDASVNQIRKRAKKQLSKLAPELANDRLFSAYKQLPKVNEFAFKMLRPMNLEKLSLVLDAEMLSYERRHAFLTNQFQKNEFYYRLGKTVDVSETTVTPEPMTSAETPELKSRDVSTDQAATTDESETALKPSAASQVPTPPVQDERSVAPVSKFITPLEIIVGGEAGVALKKISLTFDKDCARVNWVVKEKGKPVSERSDTSSAAFSFDELLYSAVKLEERVKGDLDLNRLKVSPIPTSYAYVIESSCAPNDVKLYGTHDITKNQILAREAGVNVLASMPKQFPNEEQVPKFELGVLSPHPQHLTHRTVKRIEIGPGNINIDKTTVYDEFTEVSIAPGTTLLLGKKASLIFKGKVFVNGTVGKPVVLKKSGKKAWGGMALQGSGTSGSVLSNLVLSGGSYITGEAVVYTSMLNIHDTAHVTVSGLSLSNNKGDGDGFHAAYVDDLFLEDIRVENVTMDAVDIEFSTVNLTRAWLQNVGDDGLDLMDSVVDVSDSIILNCVQHGISAGENSHLRVTDFLVAWSANGVFGKDASRVEIGTGLLMHNQTGVRTGKPTGLYGGDVEIAASSLYIMGAEKLVARSEHRKHKLDDGQILYGFVDERPLRHLFNDLLGIEDSSMLEAWLKERKVR